MLKKGGSMQNYKMVLSYDGTRYDGWQKQGNTANTIQGKLEALLSRLTGEAVEIHGSGRTDAGVHAMGQVASFQLERQWDCARLQEACNQYLPKDMAVCSIAEAKPRFHARLNAVEKTYQYRIHTGHVRNVFERNYVYEYGSSLNTVAMRAAADLLIGTHDFQSFCSTKRSKKSTVRELYEIRMTEAAEEIILTFRGNGFLYNMVRILTGTLIEVGEGKRAPETMPAILAAKDRAAAGFTAPAEGLMLMAVGYPDKV